MEGHASGPTAWPKTGGVALLVREPFALKSIAQHAAAQGQWSFARLLGGEQNVTVGVAYLPADNQLQFLFDLLGLLLTATVTSRMGFLRGVL